MPSAEKLIILAKFYNTSHDFLMDLTDERTPIHPNQNKRFPAEINRRDFCKINFSTFMHCYPKDYFYPKECIP